MSAANVTRAERRAAIGQRPMAFGRRQPVRRDWLCPASAPSRPAIPSGDSPRYSAGEGHEST